ncbi:MAG: Trehalose utilization, partial [Verrucomicrobia bacterium]|nr:Trehalose utilization [Verrucomicrobiota bacterium]
MKNALIVWGGWDGHTPRECAELFSPKLAARGFKVDVS